MWDYLELKWTPSEDHWDRFLSWKLGRSDLLNRSRYTNLLLLRLWACRGATDKILAMNDRHLTTKYRAN